MKGYEPKLVCFSCRFSWGYAADEISLSRQVKNWIPIICSGKIESTHILSAFRHGADGVLILGCPEGDCHYQDGNYKARRRTAVLKEVLAGAGLDPERVWLRWISASEGKLFASTIGEMTDALRAKGPTPMRQEWSV